MENEQLTLEQIKDLNGLDAALLTDKQRKVCEFAHRQGRKLGVTILTVSEAPESELNKAKSAQQYDEIRSRYPSRIKVDVKK
ncbi:hypothetical protein [Enterovibrio norvegicus]|uniref:hypothetical protein n=1 Tax=Enterovibrio norvegicus TaxID=188144 RepID=UPI00352C41FE